MLWGSVRVRVGASVEASVKVFVGVRVGFSVRTGVLVRVRGGVFPQVGLGLGL